MSLVSSVKRFYKTNYPPTVEKSSNPLRFGVLGAANIAPNAIVKPMRCHEDAVLVAVAARDKGRADAFAQKWGIPRTYGGSSAYQELLNDAGIDAVYIPLPNGLHYEWTMKALAAGKHVLCEKPISNNEEEVRKMFAYAAEKSLVLLESWQPHFHPALHRVKAILDEGSLGKIVKMSAEFGISRMFLPEDDIRYDFSLGGGMLMDMGPYPINCLRFLASSNPTVESAESINLSDTIDRRVEAHLTFPGAVTATVITDGALDSWGPLKLFPHFIAFHAKVECEHGSVEVSNYIIASMWHSIKVSPKGGKVRVEKAYEPPAGTGKGEDWWSAYRYTLEAFVDKVRGREPHVWRTAEDSIDEMHVIDAIYTKCGLPLRQTSNYQPS
ncbi:Probable D-xylose 1-dehydrogenase (NADP(+)) [Sparassis crispa]|uniref:D-xylose 1-dehydrogenase (NADP(+), D-xylono-1,5-lactone-forming) n=1 Tax=Sparassis crispa TaxID=139825 RepID=A0A401GZ63_9APHY|nr:Probable D-xylose 1-dehydrogenase (NADP(+)) [Sparassis crispa]GBE87442.1 Probable D-xylose 1-dehydrogenase (NADP(+)) [Sparassis crispa]